MVYRWFNVEGLTEQTQFACPRDGLGAAAYEELAEDVVDVRFDRAHGEVEFAGDLGVRMAVGDERENFRLAGAEGFNTGGLRLPRGPAARR